MHDKLFKLVRLRGCLQYFLTVFFYLNLKFNIKNEQTDHFVSYAFEDFFFQCSYILQC